MSRKKYTDKNVREDFIALRNSCIEGKEEAWDCSTKEGRECFDDMIEILDRLDNYFKITKE